MKKKGFTIIELLTVIAIITLLVGILTPGMRKAKQVALTLKQRCQLYDIEIGLEFWHAENDSSYPDSDFSATGGVYTTGAHKLAEALMGRDTHGFDSKSTWDAQADNLFGTAYTSPPPYSDRNSIYIDSDKIGNFQIAQIYDAPGLVYPGDFDETGIITTGDKQAGVLTDVFRNKKVIMPVTLESVKTGSPILYFKAKNTTVYDSAEPENSIFNFDDNFAIFALGHNIDGTANPHPYADTADIDPSNGEPDGIDDFYASLINPKARLNGIGAPVPYNKDTFILMSAGSDGLYGTSDDVTNISR